MNGLLISVVSIFIGIVSTIIVTNYYYRRSFRKSLTPYIQFFSSPLKGVDPQVRKELLVKYQDHEVNNLYEIQFIVANTGDKAIRDLIEPLTVSIPENCKLLDANILFINPEGRNIEIINHNEKKTVQFIFPLLNSGEYFITKLLLDGSPKEKDFIFTIISDELPPTIETEYLPYHAIETLEKRKFELSSLILGLIFLIFGSSLFSLVYNAWNDLPNFNTGFFRYISNLGYSGWSIILAIILTFIFFLFGAMLSIVSFTNFRFPKVKHKFIIPEDKYLMRTGRYYLTRDID